MWLRSEMGLVLCVMSEGLLLCTQAITFNVNADAILYPLISSSRVTAKQWGREKKSKRKIVRFRC